MIAAAMGAAVTSCHSHDDSDNLLVICPVSSDLKFNDMGYWDYCYDSDYDNALVFQGLKYSHSAIVTEWGGVKYYSWKGFCPTISTDNTDHSTDWVTYQWGSIAGGAINSGDPYILGCWDVNESTEAIPEHPACAITSSSAGFSPVEVFVTNSAYAYYTMLNGNDFCRKFTADDRLTLYIHGLFDGRKTGTVTVDLAKGTDILRTWEPVDLTPLGTVNEIYFQMTSTDSGQWGMNTPAYFCLDRLTIIDNK